MLNCVGATALLVAVSRAEESARHDALFVDPYAQHLMDTAKRHGWSPLITDDIVAELAATDPATLENLASTGNYASVRTRYFDDFLRDACADGPDQIVILGAGFDARVWRLEWSRPVTVYEIDLPPVLSCKSRALQHFAPAADKVRYMPIEFDLTGDWPHMLLDAGFDRSENAVWLVEGLLAHFTALEQRDFLTRLQHLSRPGDWAGLEAPVPNRHADTWQEIIDDNRGSVRPATTPSIPPEVVDGRHASSERANVTEWLADHGWLATTISSRDVMARFGRPFPDGALNQAFATELIRGQRCQ